RKLGQQPKIGFGQHPLSERQHHETVSPALALFISSASRARACAISARARISSGLGREARTSAGTPIAWPAFSRQFCRSFKARSSSCSFENLDLARALRSRNAE